MDEDQEQLDDFEDTTEDDDLAEPTQVPAAQPDSSTQLAEGQEPGIVATLPTFTGTQVGYYLICQRKLWLFTHGIQMEHTSDRVRLGKLVHEDSYARAKKEIDIDGRIKIDFIEKGARIHEVKLSDKMEDAHRWQLLYYLYYLKQKGVANVSGEINYPKLRETVKVDLTPELEDRMREIMDGIDLILALPKPPKVDWMKICRSCSYVELCWG
jgi:CRISPR-associated exonuclease Cas4